MLNTEIQQPGYVMRLRIDNQGRHTVLFNGETVSEKMVMGSNGEHTFQRVVDGRQVAFKVIARMTGFTTCRCLVLEDGKQVHASDHRLSFPKLREFFGWFPAAPRWAWIFIGLCLLIPIVTLGGAIPAVIGFIGAWICSVLAAKKQWHIAVRVMLCVIVTIASWVGLFVALIVSHSAFGK